MPLAFWILLSCAAALLGTAALKRVKTSRFTDRLDLPDDIFFAKYYAHSGLPKEAVTSIRRLVAEELEVPHGRLRPSDRFDQELRPAEGWEAWDDGLEVLKAALTTRRRGSGKRIDWNAIRTLDDFIRAACDPS